MRAWKFSLFIVFLLRFGGASAQIREGVNPFLMSIRGTATVPHPVTNKAFRRSFTGIYDATVSCDYQVFPGAIIGAMYRNNLWKTPDNKIPGLNTYAQSNNFGLRIGYDFPINETAVGFFGLTAEQGYYHFYGLSINEGTDLTELKTKYAYHALEGEGGVYFYTEGNFAIGLNASYLFSNFKFNPYRLFLNQHKAYIASDLNGTVSQLNVGFCVVFSFLKKKKK
ncbi:MAG TPA: hypothetical protein VFU15_17095 [Bacteroidia bacterium]|nr:hypothetical protein [Bacteroidia bacterium]